ncbi:unnamed protein product, partial [Prorocentrum cordatum]
SCRCPRPRPAAAPGRCPPGLALSWRGSAWTAELRRRRPRSGAPRPWRRGSDCRRPGARCSRLPRGCGTMPAGSTSSAWRGGFWSARQSSRFGGCTMSSGARSSSPSLPCAWAWCSPATACPSAPTTRPTGPGKAGCLPPRIRSSVTCTGASCARRCCQRWVPPRVGARTWSTSCSRRPCSGSSRRTLCDQGAPRRGLRPHPRGA